MVQLSSTTISRISARDSLVVVMSASTAKALTTCPWVAAAA